MAKLSIGFIVGIVVAGLLLGILLPIALNDLLGFYSTNSTVMTLVGTVLPIVGVMTIIMLFAKSGPAE